VRTLRSSTGKSPDRNVASRALRHYGVGLIGLTSMSLYVGSQLIGFSVIPAATLSWLFMVLQWNSVSASIKRLTLVLFTFGIGLVFSAGYFFGDTRIQAAFSLNMPIVALFLGISFLSMLAPSLSHQSAKANERTQLLSTVVQTNVLGGIISLPMPLIVGDRMFSRNNSLSRDQLIVVSRAFCAGAYWSPFFVSAGVAYTYAPELNPIIVFGVGALTALTGLALTYASVAKRIDSTFDGLPLNVATLKIPGALAATIGVLLVVNSSLNVVTAVTIASPLIAMAFTGRRQLLSSLTRHIALDLPSAANQVTLFLGAGVFAVGISALSSALVSAYPITLSDFGLVLIATSTGLMILASYVGLHPLVTISIVAAALHPLSPNHTVLAMMFLAAWALGVGGSPLSGTSLSFISRWGVSPKDYLIWNAPYTVSMWLVSVLVIWCVARW
jgi:hypothetical protein